MADPLFSDPRLAVLYDDFDGPRDDLDHYERTDRSRAARLSRARRGLRNWIVCCLLTRAGFDVVGVDPAGAALDVARGKAGAEHVRRIHGYSTTLPPFLQMDLALMTGNVAQVFLTDEGLSATLCGIQGALRPGGHLVFESRRPQYRAWTEWQQDPAEATVRVAGVGAVSLRRDVASVELPLVSFRQAYAFPDGTQIVSDSTLRFRRRRNSTCSWTRRASRSSTSETLLTGPDASSYSSRKNRVDRSTHLGTLVRPLSGRSRDEIRAAPAHSPV